MSRAIILMYHNIDNPPEGARIPNLYVTPRMFRFQMWYLKRAGFKVVPLQNLLESVSQGHMDGNLVALTFDDAYRDFYTNAYPVLKQYGYPSTVYVVTGLAAKDNEWDAKNENDRKPLMDWQSISEVSGNGVQIGSHTKSHPRLTTLAGEAIREELIGSKKELEERLNQRIDHFCYPYGDHNDLVKEEVRKAGYRSAVITRRGHVEQGYDPFALRRIPIKLTTNPASFLKRIHTDSEKRKGKWESERRKN
jgi:peptidoglycan/xylan/chitin deacetylase (PgdA/CDA1 family)